MLIAIIIPGTQGDVRPLVALGRGLADRGYRVRIVTVGEFRALVTGAGLEFAPLSGDIKAISVRHQKDFEEGSGIVRMLRTAQQVMREMVVPWVAEALEACRGADLLLAGGGAIPFGASIAEALDRPFVQVYLQPGLLFGHLPSCRVPVPRLELPAVLHRVLNRGLDLLTWRAQRPAVDEVVRQGLGLAPYPWFGPGPEMRRTWPVLFGFSPSVVEPPPRARPKARVTGYWFLDTHRGWTPPRFLEDFLAQGPKPIFVGLSSVTDQQARATAARIVEAVHLTGKRAVLATGWGGLSAEEIAPSERLAVIEGAPHDWLFPRVSAALHHGGAGTTAAALRAGIPSIILPFLGDQFFWAWQTHRLGAAARPLSRKTLTASEVARAIRSTDEPAMRARAARLGRRIAAETGIDTAIETLAGWGLIPSADLPAAALARGGG